MGVNLYVLSMSVFVKAESWIMFLKNENREDKRYKNYILEILVFKKLREEEQSTYTN